MLTAGVPEAVDRHPDPSRLAAWVYSSRQSGGENVRRSHEEVPRLLRTSDPNAEVQHCDGLPALVDDLDGDLIVVVELRRVMRSIDRDGVRRLDDDHAAGGSARVDLPCQLAQAAERADCASDRAEHCKCVSTHVHASSASRLRRFA